MNTLSLVRKTLIDKYDVIKNIPDDLLGLALKVPNPNNKPTKYGSSDYERLEYLGDSVLELIVAELTFNEYSLKNPGQLTEFKSRLVRNSTLYCMMSKKKLCNANVPRDKKTCADMFESILGAIYYYLRAIKYKEVLDFIRAWLIVEWDMDITIQWLLDNPNKLYCDDVVTASEVRISKSSPKSSPKQSPIQSPQKIAMRSPQRGSQNYLSSNTFSTSPQKIQYNTSNNKTQLSSNTSFNTYSNPSNRSSTSPQKMYTSNNSAQLSYKTILDNYIKNNFNQSANYISLDNNNVGVMCPKGFTCPRGQIINNYHIIGIGSHPIREQAEQIAAYNTLRYFNYL
jgi:dsRNA-specific ribonuclease